MLRLKYNLKKFCVFMLFILMMLSVTMTTFASMSTITTYLKCSYDDLIYSNVFSPRYDDNDIDTQPATHINGIKYYIANTVNTSYTTTQIEKIHSGIQSWNYVDESCNPNFVINIVQTTLFSESRCDIRAYSGSDQTDRYLVNVLGYTKLYFGPGAYQGDNEGFYDTEDMDDEDYKIIEIFLNTDKLNTNVYSTNELNTRLQVTAAHEMGHALGLGHFAQNHYLMAISYQSGLTQSNPSGNELTAVKALYTQRYDDRED